jgi:hypothetical protein
MCVRRAQATMVVVRSRRRKCQPLEGERRKPAPTSMFSFLVAYNANHTRDLNNSPKQTRRVALRIGSPSLKFSRFVPFSCFVFYIDQNSYNLNVQRPEHHLQYYRQHGPFFQKSRDHNTIPRNHHRSGVTSGITSINYAITFTGITPDLPQWSRDDSGAPPGEVIHSFCGGAGIVRSAVKLCDFLPCSAAKSQGAWTFS